MGDRMHEHEVITHIHTEASSGEASSLDPLIGAALREVFGPGYDGRWQECFATPADLAALLAPPEGTVGLLFMTDHVNEKAHALHPDAVALASRDGRLGASVEMQTWTRDAGGRVLRAPEVLIYGRTEKSCQGGRFFFGVSGEDLEIIFRECSIDGTGRADLYLVRDYCILNGYAHALAHPFDGSQLALPDLLEAVTSFKFVETVNGGFPADSSLRLSSFVSWYNKAAAGILPAGQERSPLLRRLRAKAERTGPLHPWGGSDAHAGGHDRVVMLWRTRAERPTAGDFIADMVERSARELLAGRTFAIRGAPATPISLLDDVTRICLRNIQSHWDAIRGNPVLIDILARIRAITASELMRRRRERKLLLREFDREAGDEIGLALAQARRARHVRAGVVVPEVPSLPDRIP